MTDFERLLAIKNTPRGDADTLPVQSIAAAIENGEARLRENTRKAFNDIYDPLTGEITHWGVSPYR